MGRFFKWILVFGFLGAVGWIAWKWYGGQGISRDAFSLIPADAIYCLAADDPIGSWKKIAGSVAWSHLHKNTYFAALTASANSLDSLVHENDILFDLIGSRALVLSAHMTTAKQYDFLFLVDLQQVSGMKFLKEYLTTFSTEGFSISKEKYGEEDLITLHNPSDKSNLYLSLPGTYLLVSYTKKIITAALDTHQGPPLTGELFMEAENDLGRSGILQLYVNYTMLPKLLTCYTEGGNEYVHHLAQTLRTTSLDMTLEDELIRATGYTYVNDSMESYLKTLSISGKGATEFLEIAPQRTAFCLGLGFSSFKEFFENFEKNLQQDVSEYKNYREGLTQIESYLKISVQENLINWIGDEVALFELQSSGQGLDNEVAVVLKAENIEKARKNLAYIEKMVRRKTPVKFKAVDYHGFSIEYLGMKGVFKILLGKFFARYDKPYYTIINNFVIFSNHPQTLESIIDDYLGKSTLIRSEEFRAFRKEFADESSVFVYVNTPVLFNTLKKLADGKTRSSMESNKEYIVCFRQAGFQLVPESGRFKTIFAEQFVEPPPSTILAGVTTSEGEMTADSVSNLETPALERNPAPVKESDPMELPYIYVQNLNAKSFREYFSDSTLYFEVDLKNGFKEGSFTEYYQNGEVKMDGHFKMDKREGTWRLYDQDGKLVMRRSYNEGEVKKEKVKNK